jgi:predicted ABC-type ATPase
MQSPISPLSIQQVHRLLFPADLQPSSTPTVYAMAGIPAAGKSTFVAQAQNSGLFPRPAFMLNPDVVMTALPEYRQLHHAEGAEKAFEKLELPARKMAYDFLDEAVRMRYDIIKDMGNARQENLDLLIDLKQQGYRLVMYYITVSADEAIRRTQVRQQVTGRHTPTALVHERLASLSTLLTTYRKIADEFHTRNNNDLDHPFRDDSVDVED